MKRAYLAAAMLLFLIVTCALLSRQLSSVTLRLTDEIATIETAVRGGGDPAEIEKNIDRLLQSWDAQRPILVALNGRGNCEPIETSLATIKIWHEDGNRGELLATLSELSAHISELWELQAPRLVNLL